MKNFSFLIILLFMLMACSDTRETAPQESAAPSAGVFSNEDKRIAGLLSIGDAAALDDSVNPYERAKLCRDAVDVMATRLRAMNALDAAQMRELEAVQDLFERRVANSAGADQQSGDAQGGEADLADEQPDVAQQTRIAIACVRELQG